MKHFEEPSRADAWPLTRDEKTCMLYLTNTVSAMMDAGDMLKERCERAGIPPERMKQMLDDALEILKLTRLTIPEKQRLNLLNIAKDYQLRLVPVATPSKTNVVVGKEDFRALIDAAQVKCQDCTETGEDGKKCPLFELLTVVLPLDHYERRGLCPYNNLRWEN